MRLFLLPAVLILSACNLSKPNMTQKVVVDVDGRQMTAQAFAQELAYRLKDQDALSAKDPKLVQITKARIVEDFIVQTMTESWAKEHGLIVKAEDLENEIKAVQKSYPDDLAFQQALAEEGTTFKAWKDRLADSVLQKRVARHLVEKITPPSEVEMQAYYQGHKPEFTVAESAQVRQILVAAESDARTMENELKRGVRMTDLAKKYSISPEGPQGGMVGWIEKGLTDVFEPAFRMKSGQRSPIIKSTFGYHIFEVAGRKPSRAKPYADVKDDIKRNLIEKKEQSAYLAWLEEQVRKSRVFKDQEFIDALKVETRVQ
ncbi:MAG: peptidyl-prolyl cis-trans isomerase [Bdellovibrionales bacterium]|nr:peptidyl-prolyl cis-trans isomerase [Bdellovibrionales bacterium]